jgi:ABC-type branched-subunit amino acid transport system ATPase component
MEHIDSPTTSWKMQGISGGYGGLVIVDQISVGCQSGQVVGIIGPNGSGKSTFAKCVLGLADRYSGRLELDGVDVSSLRPYELARQGVAYVPQVDDVFPSLTVKENLDVCSLLFAARGSKDKRLFALEVERVLERAPEVKRAWRRPAGTLSGGERKLLAICRVLVQGARILMLDEPTAGLSEMYAQRVWSWLAALAGDGTAIVVIEQNVKLLLDGADWVHVFSEGRCHASASAAEMKNQDLARLFFDKQSVDTNSPG